MRIAQTADGRYIKVLSPQMQGVIGRLYKEIEDRKRTEGTQDTTIVNQTNKIGILTSQVDAMTIRYTEMTDILRRMFPENEPIAVIEKPLSIAGSIKATTLISTEAVAAPLEVASAALVNKLNVEFLGGDNIDTIRTRIDDKVQVLAQSTTLKFTTERTTSNGAYAPIAHVNAAGPGVHPVATQAIAGFQSASDKLKQDRLELPGGMIISNTAPVAPRLQQVWIDVN